MMASVSYIFLHAPHALQSLTPSHLCTQLSIHLELACLILPAHMTRQEMPSHYLIIFNKKTMHILLFLGLAFSATFNIDSALQFLIYSDTAHLSMLFNNGLFGFLSTSHHMNCRPQFNAKSILSCDTKLWVENNKVVTARIDLLKSMR